MTPTLCADQLSTRSTQLLAQQVHAWRAPLLAIDLVTEPEGPVTLTRRLSYTY